MSLLGTNLWSDSWDLESSVVSLLSRNHELIFLFVPLWLVGMTPFFKLKFNYGNASSLIFLVFP